MYQYCLRDLSLYRCWLLKGRNRDISVTLFCYSCNILQSNIIIYTGIQYGLATSLSNTHLYIALNFSGEIITWSLNIVHHSKLILFKISLWTTLFASVH